MYIISDKKTIVSLHPRAGQVKSWSRDGLQFLYQGSSIKRSGIPILFPFANPLKDDTLSYSNLKLGQHGFGRDVEWTYEQISNSKAKMELYSSDLSPQIRQAYPFEYTASITVEVRQNQNSSYLVYTLSIVNNGTKDMPVSPGLHPYFPIFHNNKKDLIITQDNGPLDMSHIDFKSEMEGNFFDFNTSSITFKDFDLTISSPNKDLKHLVIWSQPPSKEDYDFICIEEFTRATNGINENPIWIKPNKQWKLEVIFVAKIK